MLFMLVSAQTVDERRDFPRSILTATLEVHTPTGIRHGFVVDLSRSGIRVEIGIPPPVGTPVLVKWADNEVMGQVIWERVTHCGIRFDRHLADGLVEEMAMGARRGPPATVSNIPVGQRRPALKCVA